MKDLVQNRKGTFDYLISETFEAGIVLLGTEIKSIRDNGGSLQEAYIKVIREELWLIGAHIAPYSHGNIHNHEERRDRKLLMHKKEIQKLEAVTREKGMALVPLALYLKNGRVKLKFGLGKGKKHHDKRQTILEREKKKEMDRAIKGKSS